MSIFSIKIEGSVDVNHRLVGATLTNAQFSELKQLLINNQGILMDVAIKLGQIAQREEAMADDVRTALDELTTQVAGLEDSEESLITYVQGLAAQLQQNAGNTQAIRDIASKLQSDARRMSDAVLTPGTDGGTGSTGAGGTGGGGAPSGGGAGGPAGGSEPGGGEPPTARRG